MAGAESRPGATSLARIYPLILLCTAIWGGTPVAGKLAIRDLPPMTVGVLRYGLASLALMVLFGRHLPSWRELRRSDLWVLLGVGVLGTFLNHILFFLGLIFAPASHGAIIPPTTSPIWTMLLAARLAREQITRSQIAGTVVCMVGVVLVARPDGLGSTASARLLLGDLFYLLGGMAWGLYSFLSKVAMHRLSALATLAYGMAIGCVFLIPVAILERPWVALASASPLTWASVLYLTVAGTILAFFWWNLAIQRVGAGRTAVFTNLVPVFGVLLAWWVLGERLTPLQLFGGLLTVAGVWVCQGPGAMRAAWREARVRLGGERVAAPEKR
ncbi:MAG: DMT family transporter [candidate division NC10 bacterium]|nr:DMT family transporter [candidate division NC10 bacterium]